MKLVILDRDGVINEDSLDDIKTASEWRAIPGSLPAIAKLSQNGYRVVVATNQSGIGKKNLDIIQLNEIHQKLLDHLSQYGGNIDAFFYCPHDPKEKCECRKPKTGLLENISKRLHVSLKGVPIVGDKKNDIDAAVAVGAIPYLVRTGMGEDTLKNYDISKEARVFDSLADVVDDLIQG